MKKTAASQPSPACSPNPPQVVAGNKLEPDLSVVTPLRDHKATLSYARVALDNIVALRQPADPPSFEVWYAYATGSNPVLNQAINEVLQKNGTMQLAELNRLYDAFLAPAAAIQRIDVVGGMLGTEADRLVALIDRAATSAVRHGESLTDASKELSGTQEQGAIRIIVERLLRATKAAESDNAELQGRLKSSRDTINDLQAKLDSIRAESITDALTKLSTRRYFDETLAQAIEAARGEKRPLSLLMCDVDHFKKFNDEHGHAVGDQVLRLIGDAIKNSVRGQDTAARYGGEEFAVVLPSTNLHQAMAVAENIRRAVTERELIKRSTNERIGRITVSIGAAELLFDDTAESLIERADANLYSAKRSGRNRVIGEALASPA